MSDLFFSVKREKNLPKEPEKNVFFFTILMINRHNPRETSFRYSHHTKYVLKMFLRSISTRFYSLAFEAS